MLMPTALVLYMFRDCIRAKYLNVNNNKEVVKQEKNEPVNGKIARNVDIIATLGKDGWDKIPSFCESGATIFRINGSHIKSEEQLKNMIVNVNEKILNEKCQNVRVMYDTQGPEIRTRVDGEEIKIQVGDKLVVDLNSQSAEKNELKGSKKGARKDTKKDVNRIGVNYEGFINDVKQDMILTIENRVVYAKVQEINQEKKEIELVITEINTKDGTFAIGDRMHINLIGEPVSLPTLTENDKKYIAMSVVEGVKDYAISFVRDENDIDEVKNIIKGALQENGKSEEEISQIMKDIRVIAKIETKQGLDNLDDIMQCAKGAMVARGDLASEIPVNAVPYAKKKIIDTCNKYKKFSILATDVLESLTKQDIPSRNDLDVIATALQLNVSSIMLSNETAKGDKGTKAIGVLKSSIDYYNNEVVAN